MNRKTIRFLRKLIHLVCALCLVLFVPACINDQGDDPNKGNTGEKVKDSLVLAVSEEPETGFDPTVGWSHSGSSIVHDYLFVWDSQMKIAPRIATSYAISEDGLTWTVSIRNDVRFSDGTPLKASDVSYTFNATKANKDSVTDLTMMKSARAIDDSTVEFTLNYPFYVFLDALMTVGIVPEQLHKQDPATYAQKPIGCGPYVLKQWDRGQQAIFEINENYFGDKPSFKRVTLLFLDADTAISALKAGQVDMVKVSYLHASTQIAGMKTVEVYSSEILGICFPMPEPYTVQKDGKEVQVGNSVTSDIAIRQAINIALDREDMVKNLLNGYGSPAYTGYEKMPWNNNSTIKDNDMAKARGILSAAGWVAGSDGILVKNGIRAEFDLIYTQSGGVRQDFALYVRDKLRELGIKVNPTYKTWGEAALLFHSSPTVFAWGESSPIIMYQLMHSDFMGMGFFNSGYYSNKTVDEYLMKALASRTEEEANGYWQKAIFDGTTGFGYEGDVAWAWFMNMSHMYIMDENLDIGTPAVQKHGGNITENIVEWKMKK